MYNIRMRTTRSLYFSILGLLHAILIFPLAAISSSDIDLRQHLFTSEKSLRAIQKSFESDKCTTKPVNLTHWYCSLSHKRCDNHILPEPDFELGIDTDDADGKIFEYLKWLEDSLGKDFYSNEASCNQVCSALHQVRNAKMELAEHQKAMWEKDEEALNLIKHSPIHVIPVGICCTPEPHVDRPVILVQVDGLKYFTQRGTYETYIPFYQSTGTFSGNPLSWFPFYGMLNDSSKSFKKCQSVEWFGKARKKFYGNFGLSLQSEQHLKEWVEIVQLSLESTAQSAFLKRNESDFVLYHLSKRLSTEFQTSSGGRVFKQKGKAAVELKPLSNSELNVAIGKRNIFGVDLSKVSPTPDGIKKRELQKKELNEKLSDFSKQGTPATAEEIQSYFEAIQLPMIDELD